MSRRDAEDAPSATAALLVPVTWQYLATAVSTLVQATPVSFKWLLSNVSEEGKLDAMPVVTYLFGIVNAYP